jgi:hypothetical protein
VEEIASLKLKISERSFELLVPLAEELIDADDGVSCYEAHTMLCHKDVCTRNLRPTLI